MHEEGITSWWLVGSPGISSMDFLGIILPKSKIFLRTYFKMRAFRPQSVDPKIILFVLIGGSKGHIGII